MKKTFLYFTGLVLIIISTTLFLACSKSSSIENGNPPPPPPSGSNTLLANPQQGNPFTSGTIDNFTFASNGRDVALIIGNSTTGKIYAIDIKDNDASQAAANAITTIDNFETKIAQAMGVSAANISTLDMALNPISKVLYVLVENSATAKNSLIKITNGSQISLVDLSNVSYSTITFSTNGNRIQDMTWGENELYVSMGNFALGGEAGKIGVPFTHNSSITKRNTAIFRGTVYSTSAPLEKMAYGKVNNIGQLIGLTTCAPGYSVKASELNNGSGLLQVKQYFDLAGGMPVKAFCVNQGPNDYLIELHLVFDGSGGQQGRLIRMGEKYIDESQTNYNASAIELFNRFTGARTTGLTDDDVKIYTGNFVAMAKYNETQVLVLNDADKLSLLNL